MVGRRRGTTMAVLPLVALVLATIAGFLVEKTIGSLVVTIPRVALTRHFYKKTNTCENVEALVKHQVTIFWKQDKSITPKLLRLVYSDCMVNGCDASILLDGSDSEKTATQNSGLGAFLFIDKVKQVIEQYCPRAVSCADILQLATRDAVSLAGGPSYIVLTGRRDGLSSKASSVNLPSPNISWDDQLHQYFRSRGLNAQDMTTLLGAHSMGQARCRYIKDRLYNFQGTGNPDPTLDSSKLQELMTQCPRRPAKDEHEGTVYLNKDSEDKFRFSNSYYTNVLSQKSVLRVDQQLSYGNDTLEITRQFADPKTGMQDFKKSFALSVTRLGAYKVLIGEQGEVRRNCRFANANNPHLRK